MRKTEKLMFVLAVCVALAAPAGAQDATAFFRERTLNLVVGFAPGGGYDSIARLVARALPRHLPGLKAVAVRNMAGAGSLSAANHLFNISPRDGGEIGLVAGDLVVDPVIGGTPTQFDARRFNILGSPNQDVGVCIARSDAPFAVFEDLRWRRFPRQGVKVGPTNRRTDQDEDAEAFYG